MNKMLLISLYLSLLITATPAKQQTAAPQQVKSPITTQITKSDLAAEISLINKTVGHIVVFTGEISIYKNAELTLVEKGTAPIEIKPGWDIKLGKDASCQILLENQDVVYVTKESQITFTWMREGLLSFEVKYGYVWFKGKNDIYFKTRGVLSRTVGGSNFVLSFNRSKLLTSVYNFSAPVRVKHLWNEKVYEIGTLKYITMDSYSGDKKFGELKKEAMDKVSSAFDNSFRPDGSLIMLQDVPGSDVSNSKTKTYGGNIDYIRRKVGVY